MVIKGGVGGEGGSLIDKQRMNVGQRERKGERKRILHNNGIADRIRIRCIGEQVILE
jgi:hypothetical protein